MTTLFLPEDLLITGVSDASVKLYREASDIARDLTSPRPRVVVVAYERQAPEVQRYLGDRDWLILVSFGHGFEYRPPNIFSVDGEKINAYTLFAVSHLLKVIDDLKEEIVGNYNIGVDLSSEKDPRRLWDKILSFSRRATRAEAGTLYLMSRDRRRIYFVCSQNEKLNRTDIERREIPFNTQSLVGFVCATGETLNIPDAYAIPEGTPYSFNRQIDVMLGYRTHSILTVPMKTPHGEVIGAVQLLNKREMQSGYLPFTSYDELLLQSLASLAAVTVENNRLYEDISRLFDSLILTLTKALEQRDPATQGHSVRVTRITLKLLEIIAKKGGPALSGDERRAAEIAGMLHDFGKIGTREQILTKVNKLYPADRERAYWRARYLAAQIAAGRAGVADRAAEAAVIARFVWCLDALDRPGRLSDEDKVFLDEALTKRYDIAGETVPLLTEDEYRYLIIPAGNLTPAERAEMERHVVTSWELLRSMQWPLELAKVPEIVLNHHEKLDGSGYPNGKRNGEIGIVERALAVADIYDALTATDRSYKKAIPRDKALAIVRDEAARGKIDGRVVELLAEHIEEVETFVREGLEFAGKHQMVTP